MRQALIQKNLSGVYSDEIFKEQNKLIEDQIISLNIAKDDAFLAKYNLEDIIIFMKDKFSNLGKTYQISSLSQIRVLLCSIFPNGMQWDYPGLDNTPISSIYQAIRMFDGEEVPSVLPRGFEPPTPRSGIWCSIQLSYGSNLRVG